MSDVRTLLTLTLPLPQYALSCSQRRPPCGLTSPSSFVVVVVASVVIICHGAQKPPAFVAALKSGDEAEALRLLADDGSLVGLKDTVRNNTHANAHAQVLGLDETSTSAVCTPLSCA